MFFAVAVVAYLNTNPQSPAFNSRQMLRLMTRTSHRRLDHLRTRSPGALFLVPCRRLPVVFRSPRLLRNRAPSAFVRRGRLGIGGSLISACPGNSIGFGLGGSDRSGWSASSSSCSSCCAAILPPDSQVIFLLLRARARFHRCLLFSRNGRAIRDYC